MDDLISRQAAIDALIELSIQRDEWDSKEGFSQKRGIDAAICAIEDLPSAERRGRWIDGKRMRFDGTFHWFRQFSECLYERKDDNSEKDTNYCPNCGARMDGDEK